MKVKFKIYEIIFYSTIFETIIILSESLKGYQDISKKLFSLKN